MITSVMEIKQYLTDIYVYILEMNEIASDFVSHYFKRSLLILATEMEFVDKNNSMSDNFIDNIKTVVILINRVEEKIKLNLNKKFVKVYSKYFNSMNKLLEVLNFSEIKYFPNSLINYEINKNRIQ